MVISVPYIEQGVIHIETVTKDKFFIASKQGEQITSCIVVADHIKIRYTNYYRLIQYTLINNKLQIINKAVKNETECLLSDVEEWADITEEIIINNVEQLPIGIYKCPASQRNTKNLIGVPITYGCDDTIKKIHKCLQDIEDEFDNKKVKIFADQMLFDKDFKLTDLYVKINNTNKMGSSSNIDVFDPAFRDTAYYNKLNNLFAQLEKEVGTSRGILTDLSVQGATATEIKRAMVQTFNVCDNIRKNAEEYIKDLIYGVNLLANVFNLTPSSEYIVNFDWAYSILEDSTESFNQLLQAKSTGAVSTAEIRNFIRSAETIEESQEAVDKIKKEEPSMSSIIGE